jgi:hypothetical protein
MSQEQETKGERNLRLFKEDLQKLLKDRQLPLSTALVNPIIYRWDVMGDLEPIYNELGWQTSHANEYNTPVIERIPPEETVGAEHTVQITLPKAKLVIVDTIPRAHRHYARPNSDGETPSMDMGYHPAGEE